MLPNAPAGTLGLLPGQGGLAGRILDEALAGIAARYGEPTAAFVAAELEYPRR